MPTITLINAIQRWRRAHFKQVGATHFIRFGRLRFMWCVAKNNRNHWPSDNDERNYQ